MSVTMDELVDIETALNELGIGMSAYLHLCANLKEFVDDIIPQIEKSLNQNQLQQAQELVHNLKGALKNLWFIQAGKLAGQLELICTGVGEGAPDEVFENLKQVLDASLKQMNL